MIRRVLTPATRRAVNLAVIVAALGYFVDIYDLILFAMIRTRSVTDLGVGAADLKDQGIYLFNMQMGGLLIGGILWGIIGDKRGRLSVLFGSITMYSLANLANGFVDSMSGYAICRLVAGIGLAGELGAGVTLVSELMGQRNRGIGTAIIAGVGISGGLLAGWIGGAFGPGLPWRTAYFIGGGLGLGLLLLRLGVIESGMFRATVAKHVERGNFLRLFSSAKRLRRYLAIICVGLPIWYTVGVLYTFSNDLGKALGLAEAPNPARVLFFDYGGAAVGGVLAGLVSQYLQSRRRTLAIFMAALGILVAAYFVIGGISSPLFYTLCGLGGVATGYWAVFMSTASELFGTNLRATVTTTAPNFVRGAAVLFTTGFKALTPPFGLVGAAIAVGVFAFGVGVLGLLLLPETFSVDLDFHEIDEVGLPRATAA
jgi:MFS transporter, putative metabolite:H+ symporter